MIFFKYFEFVFKKNMYIFRKLIYLENWKSCIKTLILYEIFKNNAKIVFHVQKSYFFAEKFTEFLGICRFYGIISSGTGLNFGVKKIKNG